MTEKDIENHFRDKAKLAVEDNFKRDCAKYNVSTNVQPVDHYNEAFYCEVIFKGQVIYQSFTWPEERLAMKEAYMKAKEFIEGFCKKSAPNMIRDANEYLDKNKKSKEDEK